MFLKTGKIGKYTYMITGVSEYDVMAEVSINSSVVDIIENVSLKEALSFVENYFNVTGNDYYES